MTKKEEYGLLFLAFAPITIVILFMLGTIISVLLGVVPMENTQ